MMGDTLEMVLVGGEWRAVGIVTPEEMEELARTHDAGDARAEARLELLLHGRPERADPPIARRPARWND
jgi:hypothetical protein